MRLLSELPNEHVLLIILVLVKGKQVGAYGIAAYLSYVFRAVALFGKHAVRRAAIPENRIERAQRVYNERLVMLIYIPVKTIDLHNVVGGKERHE